MVSYFLLQSVQGDNAEADSTTSSIYEAVRSEVRRAISEIQNDLEIVSYFIFHYVSVELIM